MLSGVKIGGEWRFKKDLIDRWIEEKSLRKYKMRKVKLLPPSAELSEIADKIKHFSDLIDYWAIDWDYKGDTFHNMWQSFRTKKNPKVDLKARYKYEKKGEYQIMVKVVYVFGNDTNKVLKVRVK